MKLMHVTIQTDKFEKEIEFYEKFAGLKVMQDMRPMGKNIVFLAEDKTDTCIEIIENKDAENAGNINLSIGFHAEDTDAKRNELATAGFDIAYAGCQLFLRQRPCGSYCAVYLINRGIYFRKRNKKE